MNLARAVRRAAVATTGALAVAALGATALVSRVAADAPSTPIPLYAEPLSDSSIRLYFRDMADDERAFDVVYYERYVPGARRWVDTNVPAVPGTGTTAFYDVTRLKLGTEYCFFMRAWNTSEGIALSGDSGEVCAMTAYPLPAAPPPTPTPKPTPKPVTATTATDPGVRVSPTPKPVTATTVRDPGTRVVQPTPKP